MALSPPLLVAALFGLYAIYDAVVFYAVPEQRLYYALAVGPVLVAAALVFAIRRGVALPRLATLTLVSLCLLPIAGALASGGTDVTAIAADLVTFLLPLAVVVLASRYRGLHENGPALLALVGLLAAAAVLAPLFGQNQAGRFQPPPILLASWLCALLAHRSGRLQVLAGIALLTVIGLSFGSGSRASLLTLSMLAMLPLAMREGLLRFGIVVALAGVLGVFVASSLSEGAAAAVAGTSRMAAIGRGEFADPMEARLEEERDIRAEIAEWGPSKWLLGAGHGSRWTPVAATVHPQNIKADGTIHQIHITPVALLYRCGIPGLVGYLLFLVYAVRPWLSIKFRGSPSWGVEATCFRLAMLAYALISMVQALIVDPVFSLVLAGALMHPLRGGTATRPD